jgi:pimeloyl-ACP methyl ester carboxylesterase
MKRDYQFLWVNVSPSFKVFHRNLFDYLAQDFEIGLWEYHQTLDESSTMSKAEELLHKYLSHSQQPVHLIGHGMSGTLAWCYARSHPEKVASLSLLSVPVQPAIDWQSYYYYHLRSLPYERSCILKLIASSLFPDACPGCIQHVANRLAKDLLEAPSDHSLWKFDLLPQGGVEMPLLLAAAEDDVIAKEVLFTDWLNYLQLEDEIWHHPSGGHFFHHWHPEDIGRQIQEFWQQSRSPQKSLVAALS